LLDCVDSTELAANYFPITQAEERLRKDGVVGEEHANATHHEVGREVRHAMQRISGLSPEELPAVPSLKRLPKP